MIIKPEIFYLSNTQDLKRFRRIKKLLSGQSDRYIIDELDQQLEELYSITHPESISSPPHKNNVQAFKVSCYGKQPKENFGSWAYYPWNNYLVHILPEVLHTKLRTSRNRNLITEKEQKIFYNARIGIAGLSVGNSAVAAITYTGGPKHMCLADHDRLSVSNLNRIHAGIWQVGLKKTDIAAQLVYEINPYADLTLYPQGLTKENMKRFLTYPKKLNVVVDEMDSLYLKIQLRMLARRLKIPVVMATDNGDGILIDIELFDLEPNRPLFHGDISEKKLLAVPEKISRKEAAEFIVRLVGSDNVAPRMTWSLKELGKTLYTWPQLGTAAFLAGCTVAYAARKIILRAPIKQGKFVVSFDEILSDTQM
jgi:molybdopterin/thiamine biosynthesis adenylyltransferase